MTGAFKVGEVCVGQNFIYDLAYNGTECVIIGEFRERMSIYDSGDITVSPCYKVEWADGTITDVDHRNLRRKQPPTGLASILRMFDLTAPAPREVETA